MKLHVDWLRLIRVLTQYVAPGLVTIVLIAEITDGLGARWCYPPSRSHTIAPFLSSFHY
jgi:hypothetical protein